MSPQVNMHVASRQRDVGCGTGKIGLVVTSGGAGRLKIVGQNVAGNRSKSLPWGEGAPDRDGRRFAGSLAAC